MTGLLLVLGGTSIAFAEEDPLIATVGNWDIRSATYDDGSFNGCYAATDYPSGITLGIAVNEEYALELIMWNNAWTLREDDEYSVRIQVDRFASHDGEAWAMSESSVLITTQDDAALYDQLQEGKGLTITASGGAFQFGLEGSKSALERMLACTDAGVEIANQHASDPFSDGSRSSDPFSEERNQQENGDLALANPKGQRAEFIDSFIAETFGRSGLADFEIDKESLAQRDADGDITWNAPGAAGMGTQFDFDLDLVKALVELNHDEDAGSCKGQFSSSNKVRQGFASDKVFTVINSCDSQGEDGVVYVYSYYEVGDVLFRTIHAAEPGTQNAEHADDRVYNALIEYLSTRSL